MSGWSSAVLGEVAGVFNGKTPSQAEQRSTGYPVLKIKDVSELGEYRGTCESFVDAGLAEKFPEKLVRDGDMLILNAAHNADYVASKTFRAQPATFGALATGEWLVVRPQQDTLDAGFLHHWVNSSLTRRRLREMVKGIHLYPKDVARLRVPLPPLPEQRRIAAILDKADELRTKRRAALEQLNGLAEALFFTVCGGEAHRWNEATVESLAADKPNAIRTGPFGSQLLHSEFVESGIAVLGIDNAVQNRFEWARPRFISERKYRQLERYTVRPGDVLITIMGTCGRCAVVPDDVGKAINTKHLCCITLDQSRCLPSYLHACFLMHPLVRRQLGVRERGAVMPGLNMALIKQLRIPLPPLDVQHEHERIRAAVSRLKSRHEDSLEQSDTLFVSIQHQAFSGEL